MVPSIWPRAMAYGIPQGSVLGPTLLNIFYDGLLRIRFPNGASLVDLANDVALVVVNHTTEGLEVATNKALSIIEGWMLNHGIELAYTKTEAVILTRKWKYRQPDIFVGDHHARFTRSVKYLGAYQGGLGFGR